MEKLIIKAIETDVGYFVQKWNDNRYYNPASEIDQYFFDGVAALPTHDRSWLKISKEPSKIEVNILLPTINRRYELIDSSLVSEKIPISFQEEAVKGDKYGTFKAEYAHLQSLYEFKSDVQPAARTNVDFEFVVICKIDNIKEYAGLSYPVQRTEWSHEGLINLTNLNVKYQVIDKIVFPDIILPSKPSRFSSEDSYKIIRQFVKSNINPKYAQITSDYNFCFTVQKVIDLEEPYEHEWVPIIGRKKTQKRYVSDRKITCFEMTYSPENYKGYTPIKGFEGKNHEDLKQNIDGFLTNLIEEINKPLVDCPHCKGMGVVCKTIG